MKVKDIDTKESRQMEIHLKDLGRRLVDTHVVNATLTDEDMDEFELSIQPLFDDIPSKPPRTGKTSEEMEEYRRTINALFVDARSRQALREASRIFNPRVPITRRWWFDPLLTFLAVIGFGFAVYVIASW